MKEVLPSCKIVVGGWQPSYMPESLLQHKEIDYLVRGEGEEAVVALASKISEGEDRQVIAKIPGVAFMDNGKMVMTSPKVIEDVDQIPFPARHLLQMDIYDRAAPYFDAKPMDTMNVVRGCPYNCAYCETKKLWGNTCRTFSRAYLRHLIVASEILALRLTTLPVRST